MMINNGKVCEPCAFHHERDMSGMVMVQMQPGDLWGQQPVHSTASLPTEVEGKRRELLTQVATVASTDCKAPL